MTAFHAEDLGSSTTKLMLRVSHLVSGIESRYNSLAGEYLTTFVQRYRS